MHFINLTLSSNCTLANRTQIFIATLNLKKHRCCDLTSITENILMIKIEKCITDKRFNIVAAM